MKGIKYLSMIVLLLSISCNFAKSKIFSIDSTSGIDILEKRARVNEESQIVSKTTVDSASTIDSIEISSITIRHDTMSILGWAPYLVFPLDTFKTPEAILEAYPYFDLKVEKKAISEDDSFVIDVYLYTYKNSFIKLTESEPGYYLDYMSGDIRDERIVLKNSIHVGVRKADFFETLKIQSDNLLDVNTVEFICTLDGYWQYYTFKNDTLQCIRLESY